MHPTPMRVVEYHDGEWHVDGRWPVGALTKQRLKILRETGYRCRSIADPRQRMTPLQIKAVKSLANALPSSWRATIRQMWRPGARPTQWKELLTVMPKDEIAALRDLKLHHDGKWLARFCYRHM